MKIIITFGLLFLSSNLFSQENFDSTKISKETFEIVKEVTKYPGIGIRSSGFGGQPTKSYYPQEKLKEKGNISEFIELTKHPNLMVRYVALTMLAKVDTFDYLPHIIASLKKPDVIGGMYGCAGILISYTDYLISLYNEQSKGNILSEEKLDSLLIRDYVEKCYAGEIFVYENEGKSDTMIVEPYCQYGDGQVVGYRDRLLALLSDTCKYYKRLKELYKKEKNPILIYSISKCRKDIDTSIVIKGLTDDCYSDLTFGQSNVFWSLKAVNENPKEEYFKYILDLFEKKSCLNTSKLFYYLTILKYEKRQTISLLRKVIKKGDLPNQYDRVYIWFALRETNSDYFKKFEKTINITEEEKKWVSNGTGYYKHIWLNDVKK